jgi:hypothetical protein
MRVAKLVGMHCFEVVFEIIDGLELLVAHVANVTVPGLGVTELSDTLLAFEIVEVLLMKRTSAWVDWHVITLEDLIYEIMRLVVNCFAVRN